MSVTTRRAASDFNHWGHLKCRIHMSFRGCTHWNPRLLLWNKIKHDILIVSKSVASYQKYVYIKACLATVHVSRALRQVKIMFIPATGKVNYTQAKAYCHISLLSFMQKMMQKYETRNVRDETLGNVRYIYTNLPTNKGSTHELQCTMWLHIYGKLIQYTIELFLDNEGTSDSSSHDITKDAKWHRLGDTL